MYLNDCLLKLPLTNKSKKRKLKDFVVDNSEHLYFSRKKKKEDFVVLMFQKILNVL